METEDVVIPTSQEEVEMGEEDAESIDWEAKAKKAEELANNYKVRAEKAERAAKDIKVEVTPKPVSQPSSDITARDAIAIVKAGVHDDDVDEIIQFAKFKGISVSEAIANPFMKSMLQQKNEFRATAEATNAGSARRVTTKVTDEALLARARAGELPDSDEEIRKLFKARLSIKK